MKVGDPPKTYRIAKIEKKAAQKGAAPSVVQAAEDSIEVLGVPGAELTPRVRSALISLLEEVNSLRRELDEARERLGELEQLADRDPLLNILNRRAFARELNRALAMIDRYDARASLVFVDLNDLKKINDAKGHGAGDAALDHVARMLQDNVRQTDSVGRLGGDEFGVLLLQTDQAQAEKKAAELAVKVDSAPVEWKGESFAARISWGAVEIKKGFSAEQAMEHADSAMYQSKQKK